MRKLILVPCLGLTIALVATGCRREAAVQSDSTPRPGAPGGSGPGVASTVPGPAVPAPIWREVTVPAGTLLPLRLEQTVASDVSRPSDTVTATLLDPISVQGRTIVPAGSRVTGEVIEARRSGRVKGLAEVEVRFDTLLVKGDDARYPIRTGLVARRAPNTHKKDALEIALPAVGGAVIGGILGGGKGAAIGGAAGGGAGTAVVLTTRGKEVRLPSGLRLTVKLLEPVTLRVSA